MAPVLPQKRKEKRELSSSSKRKQVSSTEQSPSAQQSSIRRRQSSPVTKQTKASSSSSLTILGKENNTNNETNGCFASDSEDTDDDSFLLNSKRTFAKKSPPLPPQGVVAEYSLPMGSVLSKNRKASTKNTGNNTTGVGGGAEDGGGKVANAWSYCVAEFRANEDTTLPDMLTNTFCRGKIHDLKATGRYYLANRARMSPERIKNWKLYFHWLGFDPNHPNKFKTCHDYIKELRPEWTDDKIANMSFQSTKRIMKEKGFSGTDGYDIHHLRLRSMGGSDNPMNLLPLRKPNHMAVHLVLPLNFRNHVLSKANLRVSLNDIARLTNGDEDDLTAMTQAYSKANTLRSIAMRKANWNHAWSCGNRFDAALICIGLYPNISRREFLEQTKLAPSSDYKYTQYLDRMLQKINKDGIEFRKPTSDAAKAAYTQLTPSVVRSFFDDTGGRYAGDRGPNKGTVPKIKKPKHRCLVDGCLKQSQGPHYGEMCKGHFTDINRRPFRREDDLLLWEGRTQRGKSWVELSTTEFQSTRTDIQLKNRWYSAVFKRFISNEFGPTAYADPATARRNSSTSAAIVETKVSSNDRAGDSR